ncbi:hypothetical protein ACFLZY_00715 [Patescibacteria group bacterium]
MDSTLVDELKTRAIKTGLHNWVHARGLWLLESGVVQIESVLIGWADRLNHEQRRQLPKLAELVKHLANQEAVAWEVEGVLNFV